MSLEQEKQDYEHVMGATITWQDVLEAQDTLIETIKQKLIGFSKSDLQLRCLDDKRYLYLRNSRKISNSCTHSRLFVRTC